MNVEAADLYVVKRFSDVRDRSCCHAQYSSGPTKVMNPLPSPRIRPENAKKASNPAAKIISEMHAGWKGSMLLLEAIAEPERPDTAANFRNRGYGWTVTFTFAVVQQHWNPPPPSPE